jgi:hypothetical protein
MKRSLFLAVAGIALIALPLYAAEEHAGKAVTGSEHPGSEHPGAAASGEHPGQEHAGTAASQEHAGKEHAGQEHAGKEHAGQAATKEHAGEEHAGKPAKEFTAADIKTAMNAHIEKIQKDGKGVFKLVDKDKNSQLTLKFVKIHDPVRKIDGKGYFACTDFQVVGGDLDQLLDLDFWLNPQGDTLVVTETKVHKDAVKKEGKWEKVARYTFVNDKPVEIK